MKKETFEKIISLQKKKMLKTGSDTKPIFAEFMRLLSPEDQKFINTFVRYLGKKASIKIKEWEKVKAYKIGWAARDSFFHLNYVTPLPLFFIHFFDVPEKDAKAFKRIYKNASDFLYRTYPKLKEWGRAYSENYEEYRIALTREGFSDALHYANLDKVNPVKGISTSVIGDLISAMREFTRRGVADAKKAHAYELLKAGVKQTDIAKETGLSNSTVTRIKQEEKNGHKKTY